jgi:hypothetical protein
MIAGAKTIRPLFLRGFAHRASKQNVGRLFPLMDTQFYTFGEILWDCLHVGDAPFNFAAHFVQLGASASLISAIGQDELGDESLDQLPAGSRVP